ncbi:MAG TPA: hypothetical protein VM847_08265, partial [Tahibacter sp.]|nr:hypothetical protein [Tahibacter sp.]
MLAPKLAPPAESVSGCGGERSPPHPTCPLFTFLNPVCAARLSAAAALSHARVDAVHGCGFGRRTEYADRI